jgi:WW domain binding protein 11
VNYSHENFTHLVLFIHRETHTRALYIYTEPKLPWILWQILNMGKTLNPADAQRRREKRKAKEKNRKVRQAVRENALKHKSADELVREITEISMKERRGLASAAQLARKATLIEAHTNAVKREMEQEKRRLEKPRAIVKGLDKIIGKETLAERERDRQQQLALTRRGQAAASTLSASSSRKVGKLSTTTGGAHSSTEPELPPGLTREFELQRTGEPMVDIPPGLQLPKYHPFPWLLPSNGQRPRPQQRRPSYQQQHRHRNRHESATPSGIHSHHIGHDLPGHSQHHQQQHQSQQQQQQQQQWSRHPEHKHQKSHDPQTLRRQQQPSRHRTSAAATHQRRRREEQDPLDPLRQVTQPKKTGNSNRTAAPSVTVTQSVSQRKKRPVMSAEARSLLPAALRGRTRQPTQAELRARAAAKRRERAAKMKPNAAPDVPVDSLTMSHSLTMSTVTQSAAAKPASSLSSAMDSFMQDIAKIG